MNELSASSKAVLRFKTGDLKRRLEPLCLRALAQFNLPDRRLLCFFDDEDPSCFTQRFGLYYGFRMTVKGSGFFPPYITPFFYANGGFAFDDVIYLRGSTC